MRAGRESPSVHSERMNPVHLARAATFLIVVVGGGLLGHVFMPVRGGFVLWGRLAGFLLVMAGLGALRGWREGVTLEEPVPRIRRRTAIYAGAAVVLALLGYLLIHGRPVG